MNKANEKNDGYEWPFEGTENETKEQLMERIKAMEKEISRLLKAYKELNKAIKTHKNKQQ